MINAFSAHPAIATKHEAMIAKAMHKHKGPGAGMTPKFTKVPGVANPRKVDERYSRLIKFFPKGWNTARDIGAAWGMTRASANNIIYRMSARGLVERRKVGGKQEWRVKV